MTYENILARCLEKCPSDLDTREGGFIYTVLAPICFEISNIYFEMQNMLELSFIETSFGEYLDRISKSFAMTRKEAVKNIKKANIISEEEIIGENFSVDKYVFQVLEKQSEGVYLIEATEFGTEYNNISGKLSSVMNLTGIVSAEIMENYILASDIEGDEDFRARILSRINTKPYGGNVEDYREKTLSIPSVKYAYIFTGDKAMAGNVHIIISGENKSAVLDNVINECLVMFNGDEDNAGVAPIGHNVSVSTNNFADIDISFAMKTKGSFEIISNSVKTKINEYIDSLEFYDDTISIAKLLAKIFTDDKILDVKELRVNGFDTNFILSKEIDNFEVAKIRNISITSLN